MCVYGFLDVFEVQELFYFVNVNWENDINKTIAFHTKFFVEIMECLRGAANYADVEVELQGTHLRRISPWCNVKDEHDEWISMSLLGNGLLVPHFELGPESQDLIHEPCSSTHSAWMVT